jgi:hypothetical protein
MESGAAAREGASTWRSVRPWVLGALALPALLIVVGIVHDALVYRAIRRVARRGGLVVSWSDPLPDLPTWTPGWVWSTRRLILTAYVVRDRYEVTFGTPFLGCGTGITLATSADDAEAPSDEGMAAVRGLAHVHKITVREARITDAGLRHLAGLDAIDDLTLERVDVAGPGLAHLRGLRLDRLSLRGSPVDDAGLADLDDLPLLRVLDLGRTRVTGAGLAGLARLPALRALDLEGTRIDDGALRHLAALPALDWLDLDDTDVTEQGLAELDDGKRVLVEVEHAVLDVDAAGAPAPAIAKGYLAEVLADRGLGADGVQLVEHVLCDGDRVTVEGDVQEEAPAPGGYRDATRARVLRGTGAAPLRIRKLGAGEA